MIRYIYPIIFYIIMFFLYRYSKGKINSVKKSEKYLEWVRTKGKVLSKAVLILTLLYTIFYILSLF